MAGYDHYHFRIWEYGRIIVDMIRHMSYFGARNDVKTDVSSVGCLAKDGRGEEEILVLDLWLSLFSPVYPARAFAVRVPCVAISTFERLAAIRNLPFMALLSVLAGPQLLSSEMFLADLDEDFPLAIEEVRTSMLAPFCWLNDDGA